MAPSSSTGGTKGYYPDNFDFRRKAQKVYVERGTNDVILRLHETDIVRVKPSGDVVLSTGGWATHKTMKSMNDALELFNMYVEAPTGNVPGGRWRVIDSDGSEHPYNSDKVNYIVTIPSKGGDDRNRAKWLADAYEVPWTPTAAAPARTATRVVSAPAVPRVVAQASAAAANGSHGAAAAAPRAAGGTGSWANIARGQNAASRAAATGVTHPARMTGPGGAAAAAAAAAAGGGTRVTTGLGAAAGAYRPTGPPGFGSSGGGSAAPTPAAAPAGMWPPAGAAAGPAAAAAVQQPMSAAAVGQLAAHIKQLGLDEEEDDSHLCVVCMEEPRSIVLVPCGHMALCRDCCETIIVQQKGQCPMCCQDVEYHVEVDQ